MSRGLLEISSCEDEESFKLLAMNFTASQAHFGSLETVELERGGQGKTVTISNKEEFVSKLCKWHLIGMLKFQASKAASFCPQT